MNEPAKKLASTTVAVVIVAAAFGLALLITGGGRSDADRQASAPATATPTPATSVTCVQSEPGKCDGATGATGKAPAPEPVKKKIPLSVQASRLARRYVVASGSYNGNAKVYRRNVGKLLADPSARASTPRGLEEMRSRVVAVQVQYANEMGAVVLVSAEQTIGRRVFLTNTQVTLTREGERYSVDDAQLLGGGE